MTRAEDVKLTRLRLRHYGLASGLIFVGKQSDGTCEHCGISVAVNHIIMHCTAYTEQMRILFIKLEQIGLKSLSLATVWGEGLGERESAREVILFLSTTGLYRKYSIGLRG